MSRTCFLIRYTNCDLRACVRVFDRNESRKFCLVAVQLVVMLTDMLVNVMCVLFHCGIGPDALLFFCGIFVGFVLQVY